MLSAAEPTSTRIFFTGTPSLRNSSFYASKDELSSWYFEETRPYAYLQFFGISSNIIYFPVNLYFKYNKTNKKTKTKKQKNTNTNLTVPIV